MGGTAGSAGAGGAGGSGGSASDTDCNSITDQPILQVALNGSGQYTTVGAALNSLSGSNTTPTQIRIQPGNYFEKLVVDKPFVTLCGQTGRQADTVLTYNDRADEVGTSGSYSVQVTADDVSVENITIENSVGPGVQAVALLTQGQRTQFRNCRMIGYQDTLYTHSGTQYFRDCFVQGSVDYIFGGATAVFEDCTIHTIEGGTAITAPSTEPTVPFGIVFLGGEATAASGVSSGSQNLGRNWRPAGSTTYIRTVLGAHISAVGWGPMGENTLDTARFSEYQTSGPGANPGARAPQSQQLSDTEAAAFTVANIFGSWTPSFSQ
jgi:pectinesterase